jgi:endonuclease YncB( thermonuclease family)
MVARGWPPRDQSRNDPSAAARLRQLKRGFQRVSARCERAPEGPKKIQGWMVLVVTAALVGFASVWTYTAAPNQITGLVASGSAMTASRILVLDGDTIRIDGRRPDVRLVGFNAPETSRAQCRAERELGEAATKRLRQLVSGSTLDFDFVACACRPGTEGTDTCNYGRRCGVLRANGRDVAGTLIAEGLAVPFHCRGTGCPPTPRPWCQRF